MNYHLCENGPKFRTYPSALCSLCKGIKPERIRMNLEKVKLKVKTLSLAEEAKIIKRLEKGCVDEYGTNPIYLHRTIDVRNEARATHLARAFLSHKQYKSTEPSRKPEKEMQFNKVKKRLYKIVYKYGKGSQEVVDNWLR